MILDSDKELYAQEQADANAAAAKSSGSGFLSGLGALLGYAGKTAVDVIAANKTAGISSTDANVNPAALQAALQAQQQQAALNKQNYMPWVIGGAAVLGVVVLMAVMSRRS